MAVDANAISEAMTEFLNADKAMSDAETQVTTLQESHAKAIQAREEWKQKLIAAIG